MCRDIESLSLRDRNAGLSECLRRRSVLSGAGKVSGPAQGCTRSQGSEGTGLDWTMDDVRVVEFFAWTQQSHWRFSVVLVLVLLPAQGGVV